MANTGKARTNPMIGKKVKPITTNPRENTTNRLLKKYLKKFSDLHLLSFIIPPLIYDPNSFTSTKV
jgi:hypothetical protein